ncbi:hypothetical protein BDV93DRAFT_550180 [Ceratobasidium sp. AG-I]|nr:hypothetical protein BDV93DRAFT_550180 [Ceratobasidium sp. AG-I]
MDFLPDTSSTASSSILLSMKTATLALGLLAIVTRVAAGGGVWGQCGGIGYTGTTVCDPISTCTYYNPYFWLCRPTDTLTTTTTAPAATATSTTESV